jgi:hypothetical protein
MPSIVTRATALLDDPRRLSRLVLVTALVGFPLASLWLGQDASWDLRNYHFYNGFAVWHDRTADVAAAQLQTWFNPALDALPYLCIRHAPPPVCGLVLAAWQALNAWLLFLIGARVLAQCAVPRAPGWALVTAVVGVLGSTTVSQVGTTMHDTTVSVFILGSVLLYLSAPAREPNAHRRVLAAGVLLGAGMGLKLTAAVYAAGFAVAVLVTQVVQPRRGRDLAALAGGVLLGVALTGGPWAWSLWRTYGNPVLPMFNAFFRSPYLPPVDLFDPRFVPSDVAAALTFPFRLNKTTHAGSELPFRDLRITLLYVAAWFALFVAVCLPASRRLRHAARARAGADWSLLWLVVFVAVSYVTWLWRFGIYRYIAVVELLAPLILVAAVGRALARRGVAVAVVVGLAGLVITASPPRWGRLRFSDSYFDVSLPPLDMPPDATVLIAGDAALSFLIPYLPPHARVVRVSGNLPRSQPPAVPTRLEQAVAAAVAQQGERLYLLALEQDLDAALTAVNSFRREGALRRGACGKVATRVDDSIVLCELVQSG